MSFYTYSFLKTVHKIGIHATISIALEKQNIWIFHRGRGNNTDCIHIDFWRHMTFSVSSGVFPKYISFTLWLLSRSKRFLCSQMSVAVNISVVRVQHGIQYWFQKDWTTTKKKVLHTSDLLVFYFLVFSFSIWIGMTFYSVSTRLRFQSSRLRALKAGKLHADFSWGDQHSIPEQLRYENKVINSTERYCIWKRQGHLNIVQDSVHVSCTVYPVNHIDLIFIHDLHQCDHFDTILLAMFLCRSENTSSC